MLKDKFKILEFLIKILILLIGAYFGFIICKYTETFESKNKPQLLHKVPQNNATFFFEIYPELIIPNLGRKINRHIKFLDSTNREISIKKITNGLPVLVFRYSKFDCHVCVDQVLDKLKEEFKNTTIKPILLLDGYTFDEVRLKYKKRGIKFPIYLIKDENLGLNLENKNLPFLFVIENNDLKIDKIFIPFKEFSIQTDAYLKNIAEYLNK